MSKTYLNDLTCFNAEPLEGCTRTICAPLPLVELCDTFTGECPPCSTALHCTPVVKGQKVCFQFNINDTVNVDSLNPVYGWNDGTTADYYLDAEIIDGNGNVLITGVQNIFSEWMVGVTDTQPFQLPVQNVCLDVEAIINALPDGVNCFALKIIRKNWDGTFTNIFQDRCGRLLTFCLASATKDKHVTIESKFISSSKSYFNQRDCCGAYYGMYTNIIGKVFTPDFTYCNTLALWACVECGDFTIERVSNEVKQVSAQGTQGFNLKLNGISERDAKNLNNVFMGSDLVVCCYDNKGFKTCYNVEDVNGVPKNNTLNFDYFGVIPLEVKTCEVNFYC